MRLVVTGAAGQVGTELVILAAEAGDDVVAADSGQVDITDRDAVHTLVLGVRPDVLVNCAAYNAVDQAETDVDAAFAVNALAVRHLVEACRRAGTHLVHISSDYVFDGRAGRPYVEWDATNPLSVYGRSKRAGELEVGSEATLVRTSWVSGRAGPGNFVRTMLALAAAGGPVTVVDDQFGSPTFAADLARGLRHLALERRPGVFHMTNAGQTSWYGFAREIFTAAGHDAGRVQPVATADMTPARPAARPPYAVLDNLALRLAGLPALGDYRDALGRLVKELE